MSYNINNMIASHFDKNLKQTEAILNERDKTIKWQEDYIEYHLQHNIEMHKKASEYANQKRINFDDKRKGS